MISIIEKTNLYISIKQNEIFIQQNRIIKENVDDNFNNDKYVEFFSH